MSVLKKIDKFLDKLINIRLKIGMIFFILFIVLLIVMGIVLLYKKIFNIDENFDNAELIVVKGYVKNAKTDNVEKTMDFLKRLSNIVKKGKNTSKVGYNLEKLVSWLNDEDISPKQKVAITNAMNNFTGEGMVPSILITNVVRSFSNYSKLSNEEETRLREMLIQVYKWKNRIDENKAKKRQEELKKVRLQEEQQDRELIEKSMKEAKELTKVTSDPREQGQEEPIRKEVPLPGNTEKANDAKETFANIIY